MAGDRLRRGSELTAVDAPHQAEGFPMKQVRINKQHRPAREWLEPLPPDARDPDVVRAKQLARRADPSRHRPLSGRA